MTPERPVPKCYVLMNGISVIGVYLDRELAFAAVENYGQWVFAAPFYGAVNATYK